MTAKQPLSPQAYARLGGALYLLIIIIGFVGEIVIRGKLVVPGDATATAMRIGYLETWWRIGIAAELVLLLFAVVVTWVLYLLLAPVSRPLAILAVLSNLVGIAIEATAALNLVAALFPLGDAEYLHAFQPQQLHALATMAIRAHSYGFAIALIFCGFTCVVSGNLIYRSGYLPKTVGVLYQVAGASYVIQNLVMIVSPATGAQMFLVTGIPCLIGEGAVSLWLLAKGVNLASWHSLAQAR